MFKKINHLVKQNAYWVNNKMKEKKFSTEELRSYDRRYIWHPFTQMQDWTKENFLVIHKGKGGYIYDTDGNRYIDGVSSLWVTVHGHRKKEIDNAIKKQLLNIAHSTFLGLSNIPAVLLAKHLVDITPKGLNKVFYSDNGSTACEIALKMAFQYWQQKGETKRKRFISFENAYHGDTIGSVSLGGIDLFHKIYRPLLFKTYSTYSPYCYRCPLKMEFPDCGTACLEKLENLLKAKGGEIAGVMLEPEIQGAAGMITQPEGFVKKVSEICKKYDVLLIFDEVATGFGRTGKMFACEHSGVTPDIMALSKGITGGYLPLAATIVKDKIYKAFLGRYEEFKTFFHGHSYTANPLASAAALENINLFNKENLLNKISANEKFLKNELKKFERLNIVGDIRQKGLMAGIELVSSKKEKSVIPLKDKAGINVILKARKKGAILRPLGNVIVLMPHLSISEYQLKKLIKITFDSIKEFEKERR